MFRNECIQYVPLVSFTTNVPNGLYELKLLCCYLCLSKLPIDNN